MPDIFARIDVSMQGNGLAASLAGEVRKLEDAAGKLKTLLQNPPAAIPQLAAGIGSVAVPSLDVSAFASGIASLEGAVPADLSDVTSAITAALAALKVNVKADVSVKLDTYIEAVRAVHRLMNMSFAPPPDLFKSASEANAVAGGNPSRSAPDGNGNATPGSGATSLPPAPAQAVVDARAQRLEAIKQTNDFLATRTPFDAPGFVTFMHKTLAAMPREQAKVRKIPYFDDLLWLVSTSVALREMDEAALKQHIRQTLQNLAAFLASAAEWPLGHAVDTLGALATQLDAGSLESEAEALTSNLDGIAAALGTGSLAGASTKIAAASTALDALLPRLTTLDANLFDGQVDAATRTMQRLPLELDRQMRRVVQAVGPSQQLGLYATMGAELRASLELAAPAALAAEVEAMLAGAIEAFQSFDLGPLGEVIGKAIAALNSAVGEIDALLSGVAAKVSLAFDALNGKLAAVDPAPLVAKVNQAVKEFGDALAAKVTALFAPVKSAIEEAVKEIATAVSSFDPAHLVDALKDAIQKLVDTLDAPEVKSAIAAIRQTIDGAAKEINAISFSPLTGSVVVEIDDVTDLLKKLDPDLLGIPAKLALTGAVALLPADLKPVTDPVSAAFAELVEQGPNPVLKKVEAQPQRLLDKVQRFSPDKLIGDELGKPLAALIGTLETFKPSALLAPVQQALGGLKQDLARRANPAQAFAPIEAAFNGVASRLDALNPAALVAPLSAKLHETIDAAVTALPADETIALLDDVLATVQNMSDMAKGARTALTSAQARFAGLADGETQIRAWYAPVLAKVAAMSDVGSLQPELDAVASAVARLKAAAITSALDGALRPLQSVLATLAAGDRLAGLARAYRAIRLDVVAALPASAESTALQALLARFSPVAPSFARPFDGLERWREALVRDRNAVALVLEHWDTRFHGANGALEGFTHPAITAAELRALLSDALEREIIAPLGALVGAVHEISAAGAPVIEKLAAFAGIFEQRVNALVLGPTALGGVRDAFSGLVARMRAIDLDFLVRELETTFGAVKGKLQAVGPSAVKASVQSAFDHALASLDVANLLPAGELAALDQSYEAILTGLRALDPKKLVVEAVQPEFDKKVMPLLAAFDITVVLRALIERLDALKTELSVEFGKVDDAYKAMLAAVPTLSLTDISLDVDIDVGVDLGF